MSLTDWLILAGVGAAVFTVSRLLSAYLLLLLLGHFATNLIDEWRAERDPDEETQTVADRLR